MRSRDEFRRDMAKPASVADAILMTGLLLTALGDGVWAVTLAAVLLLAWWWGS